MSEPRLEDISDYNTLKGKKKGIVWTVVIVGILIGIIYMFAYKIYDNKADAISIKDEITVVPLSQSIPIK